MSVKVRMIAPNDSGICAKSRRSAFLEMPGVDHEEETMKRSKAVISGMAFLTMVTPLTAQKAGGTSEVRLRVSIADRNTTEDYRIESDGFGEYVDGGQGVSARLDRYGNLIVNFQVDPRTGQRRVQFDYSCPASGASVTCGLVPAEPPSGLQDRAYISTVCREVGTGVPCSSPAVQDMAVGKEQCVQLNWEFTDGAGRSWRNGFHRNRDLPNQQGTAYGVVTRNSADTWTVEPRAADCQAGNVPGVARTFKIETVRSKSIYYDFGTFWLPFKLTLTRMPN